MTKRCGRAPALGATLLALGLLAAAACGPARTPTGGASTSQSSQGAQPTAGEARALTGAGATFPAVLYSKWFDEYDKAAGVQVNYQAIGSGGGIKSISDETVDFGASDAPLTDEQLKDAKGGALLHIPMTLGSVVVTYNLPGYNGSLKLTADTLAGIYLGEITRWNDPRLVADNAALAPVDKSIAVVHRSDGSGTTAIFTDYLSAVSPAWRQRVGTSTSVNWPVGLGGKGNEGVAGEVKQNDYSLGYVELIYALQNKLGVAQLKNRAGQFVEPSVASTTAAAAGVAETIPDDLRVSIVDAAGDDAYPIAGFTYQLVYQNMTDRAKAAALAKLLWWEIHEGQQYCADLGYAPLPAAIVQKAEAKIEAITGDGLPALGAS
ncbi:MAG TPA: phosphate ABC transporter substrate-binding protein PstS [Chloroflexota bacterium]|nr:phosphate ABC transporter substrate-binding protein PstS [Chloroflexota bacterium]